MIESNLQARYVNWEQGAARENKSEIRDRSGDHPRHTFLPGLCRRGAKQDLLPYDLGTPHVEWFGAASAPARRRRCEERLDPALFRPRRFRAGRAGKSSSRQLRRAPTRCPIPSRMARSASSKAKCSPMDDSWPRRFKPSARLSMKPRRRGSHNRAPASAIRIRAARVNPHSRVRKFRQHVRA